MLPDGVGPDDDAACCSPDLDLALEGFTDASRGGLTVISCVDPEGTPVNPGACEGIARACVGLADFARLGFSFTVSKSGNSLWGVPVKNLRLKLLPRSPERDLVLGADGVTMVRGGVAGACLGCGVAALDADLGCGVAALDVGLGCGVTSLEGVSARVFFS